jgi:hypothetical protein
VPQPELTGLTSGSASRLVDRLGLSGGTGAHSCTAPGERKAITEWGIVKDARRRAARGRYSLAAYKGDCTDIRVTIKFLTWLDDQDLHVRDLTQAHLDDWASTYPTQRTRRIPFVRWAHARHIVRDTHHRPVPPGRRGRLPHPRPPPGASSAGAGRPARRADRRAPRPADPAGPPAPPPAGRRARPPPQPRRSGRPDEAARSPCTRARARPIPVEQSPNRPCHQAVPGCPLLPRCSSPGDLQRAQHADTRQSMPVHLVTPSSTTEDSATPPHGPHGSVRFVPTSKEPEPGHCNRRGTCPARSPAG